MPTSGPIINPVTLLPIGMGPLPDVSPFTVRSGATYLSILESLSKYVRDDLYTYLHDDLPDSINDGIDTIVASMHQTIVNSLIGISPGSPNGIVIAVDESGTNDMTATIQAAIDTGKDVHIVGTGGPVGIARTTATLKMKPDGFAQRLTTIHATIAPAFIGDTILVTSNNFIRVSIDGRFQPATGDATNAAAIRIGTRPSATPHYNPQQASIANSIIRSMRGSGIIWDDGSMIDFTHTYISNMTGDGIYATANPNVATENGDNNHGFFANTHVINCGGTGYRIDGNGANLNNGGSRHHVFQDAKAFGCGKNFYIASRSNVGTVFSELGANPNEFGTLSRGNRIDCIETAASFEGWVDNGVGNTLSGFSQNNIWETKYSRVRTLEYGATGKSTAFDQAIKGTLQVNQSINTGTVGVFTTGRAIGGTNFVVEHALFTSDGNAYIVSPFCAADGTLVFNIFNGGATRTLQGTISYVIKRFV